MCGVVPEATALVFVVLEGGWGTDLEDSVEADYLESGDDE
jgi:hypothetical protein